MIEIINVSKKYKKYVVPFNSLKSFFLNHKKYKEEIGYAADFYVVDIGDGAGVLK